MNFRRSFVFVVVVVFLSSFLFFLWMKSLSASVHIIKNTKQYFLVMLFSFSTNNTKVRVVSEMSKSSHPMKVPCSKTQFLFNSVTASAEKRNNKIWIYHLS